MLTDDKRKMIDLCNQMANAAVKAQKEKSRKQWWSDHGVEVSQTIASYLALGISIAALIISVIALNN